MADQTISSRLMAVLKGAAGGVPTNANGKSPMDSMLGHTPEQPDPGEVEPRYGPPFGASGRANFYGLPQPDELNQKLVGTAGLEVFDTMYRTDPHIRRLVLMCWAPIQAAAYSLTPYGGDEATSQAKEQAEIVWWMLTQHMDPNLYEHLSTVGPVLLRSGFSPFEQVWEHTRYEGKDLVVPRKLDLRLPRSLWRWWQDDYGDLTHIGQILPNKPDVVIPASELVYYRLAPEGDNWVGTSLLRYAYKPWYIKDKLERIDAIGQERKAVGVPFLFMGKGFSGKDREDYERLLASIHLNESGYGIFSGLDAEHCPPDRIDEAISLKVITFDSSAGASIQSSLKYHTDAIASAFLGDFMQLGHHQVGARATAQVQQDPFIGAVEALLEASVKPPLQKLIDRAVALNWGPDTGAPRLSVQLSDSASLSELAEYVSDLVNAQAMVADPELEDFLRERADLPPVDPDVRKEEEAKRKAQNEATVERAKEPPQPQLPPGGKGEAQGPPKPAGSQKEEKPAGNAKAGKQLDSPEPTAAWWERLLSQDRLGEAYAQVRERVTAHTLPYALTVARQLAAQAAEGQAPSVDTTGLEGAFRAHYEDLYQLGRGTVQLELRKQRRALKTLAGTKPVFSRKARAAERARQSAEQVVAAVNAALARQQVNGVAGPVLQKVAEVAGERETAAQAMENAPSAIADGRTDAALSDPQVVGGIYTAVLDGNTCEQCEGEDNGQVLSVEDAESAVPNVNCEGGSRCRCAIVWLLSEDPVALGLVGGE